MSTYSDRFIAESSNLEFLNAAMMGPNAMRLTEELALHLDIHEGMRVLDLGCGTGISTLYLTRELGATVFAADLWISPSENYERFCALGIAEAAIPISVDATKGLPFAHGYFDLLLSVDAYHYFGDTPEMLPSLVSYVKKGGYIALAIPGLKFEFGEDVPEEMKPFWSEPEVARTIRSLAFWRDLWHKAEGIEIVDIREMACCKQAWDEWLACPSPYAAEDIEMMQAENGNYFNFIQLIAKAV